MKFLSAAKTSSWASTEAATRGDPTSEEEAKACLHTLDRQLTEVLLSENLVVLAGLGTSLCVLDTAGKRLAPTMDDLWKMSEKAAGAKLLQYVISKVRYTKPAKGDNVEVLLSRCIMSEKLEPDASVKKFIDLAEELIVTKCRFVDRNTNLNTHEMFLRKVARRSIRQPRMKLFTTNYDLCFEEAAARSRFILVDGFAHLQPQEFDGSYFSYDFVRRDQNTEAPDYIPNVFHLYKLHGSLDWDDTGGRVIKNAAVKKPAIIYPRDSKFESSYNQPFLEMISRLQTALRQPNTGLLIIGFGFNDHHIVQPIFSALHANVQLKALVVAPSLETAVTVGDNNFHSELNQIADLIRAGDWRLGMLAATFEDLVKLLPDLVAKTEEEKHRERLSRLKTTP